MSAPTKASPVSVAFAAGLAILALLLWLLELASLSDLTGSDAAGNAITQAYAIIGLFLLWLLLAVLAIIAYAKGTMPGWAAIAALVLIPASGVATLGALGLLTTPTIAPYRWPIIVPALVPPLIIAFSFWALLPATHARVPARFAAGFTWGTILLLCLALVPMMQVRERVHAREEARRAQLDADLRQVPADAPLWALTPFLAKGNYVQYAELVRRIRALGRRQADAEAMLARGDFPLRYLGQLDLTPTPALCENARALLRQRVAPLTLATPNAKDFADIAGEVGDAVAALRWLIDYDCNATAEAAAWETMAKAYRDPRYDIYELRDLRDPKRLGRALNEDPAHFSMLTPRAHLKAWLKFADDKDLQAQAVAGARTLAHRTEHAVEMLNADDLGTRVLLENLPRLDLSPTPALCRAALGNIRKQFAGIYRPMADDPRPYRELLSRLGRSEPLSALVWLAAQGCDAEAELRAAEALIKAYQPSPDAGLMLGRLEELHRKP